MEFLSNHERILQAHKNVQCPIRYRQTIYTRWKSIIFRWNDDDILTALALRYALNIILYIHTFSLFIFFSFCSHLFL